MTTSDIQEFDIGRIRREINEAGLVSISALLSDDDIMTVFKAPSSHKRQPLAKLLSGLDWPQDCEVAENTERALSAIRRNWTDDFSISWLQDRIRVAKASDPIHYANASSSLGEIRAAGALTEVFSDVQPRKTHGTPVSDFQCLLESANVIVEVHTKNMNKSEAEALAQFSKGTADNSRVRQGGVSTRMHVTSPFGRRKVGESSAENVASKLAQTKSDSRQASSSCPSILWWDLQDEDMWVVRTDILVPFEKTPSEEVWTPGIWHAVYGHKDSVLLDVDGQWPASLFRQRFDGLFTQRSDWSAVVIYCRDGISLFEHPTPDFLLDDLIRDRLSQHDMFHPETSWIHDSSGPSLQSRIDQVNDELERIADMVNKWDD